MGSYDSTRTSFLPTIGKPLVHDLAEVDPIVARGLARHYILSDKLVFAIRRRRTLPISGVTLPIILEAGRNHRRIQGKR